MAKNKWKIRTKETVANGKRWWNVTIIEWLNGKCVTGTKYQINHTGKCSHGENKTKRVRWEQCNSKQYVRSANHAERRREEQQTNQRKKTNNASQRKKTTMANGPEPCAAQKNAYKP